MKGAYLLDTSTLLWALGDPARLSPAARRALNRGPLVLSVVSYWEVVIKSRKGMLQIADPVTWWDRAVMLLGGQILSIRPNHVKALAGLKEHHKDPFDRMLIAQSLSEGCVLLTDDGCILEYGIRTCW